ncbi:MotE family protein [Maricaulis sp.]|uniref:MotE family protein n=1 Tax=Maricaulis sp. TaxID=1486257 RepID=UPI003A95A5C9
MMREPMRLLAVLAILMGGLFALKTISVANGAADWWQAQAAGMEQETAGTATSGVDEAPAPAAAAPISLGEAEVPEPAPAAATPSAEFASRIASGVRTADEERVIYRLRERSVELDRRESELETREALMLAMEHRVDTKIGELNQLRTQIEGLAGDLTERESEDMNVIVSWYAAMDAGDAATRISSLDLDTQLQIASRMSQRTFGGILAEMTPLAAASLTERMAARSNLPDTVAELEARIAEGG